MRTKRLYESFNVVTVSSIILNFDDFRISAVGRQKKDRWPFETALWLF